MPDFENLEIPLSPAITLKDQLCPPISEERADWFHKIREGIAGKISSSVPQIERVLGLEQPSSAFRYDLSEAILLCVLAHFFPPERRSQSAKKLKQISKDSAATEKKLRQLISCLEDASGIYPPIKNGFLLKLREHTSDYASLSALIDGHVAALRDPGGQIGLIAFRTLVHRLIPAFESATGTTATVTWKDIEGKYEGRVLDFMREVVSMMRRLFPNIAYPRSPRAVDSFVHKCSLGRKSKRKKSASTHRRRRLARRQNVHPPEAHRRKR